MLVIIAHNPKVTGSSPVPATKQDASLEIVDAFFVLPLLSFDIIRIVLRTEYTFEI